MLIFRCKSKTEEGFRTITVNLSNKSHHCDCDGPSFTGYTAFCSHIDATLVAGERFMVPPEERHLADTAQRALTGRIKVPEGWSGSWRRNRVWRGLAAPRGPRESDKLKNLHGSDYYERPRVCFTGKGHKPRSALMEEARAFGWQVEDSFSNKVKLLVAEDVTGHSSKLSKASYLNIPVVTYGDWIELLAERPLGTDLPQEAPR